MIEVSDLTRKFGDLTAVDSISLSIEGGELFGLLGPNGAGKTTTLSMLATIIEPTKGSAVVNGFNVHTQQDEVRGSIGIVFQDPSLDEELTAYENLDFHGRLYHMPRDVREGRIDELLQLVELGDRKNNLVKTFSGGMKRRLEIARGLLHRPSILFLDEPTLGLDPQTRRHIWGYIERLNKEDGITMILTTHYMDEADVLCDRVAIIDHGRIIAQDTPKELKDMVGGDVISVRSSNPEKLLEGLKKQGWVKKYKLHDGFLDVCVSNGETRIPQIVEFSQRIGVSVSSISMREPTLEDVFLHYTGRTIREEEAKPMDRVRSRVRSRRMR